MSRRAEIHEAANRDEINGAQGKTGHGYIITKALSESSCITPGEPAVYAGSLIVFPRLGLRGDTPSNYRMRPLRPGESIVITGAEG